MSCPFPQPLQQPPAFPSLPLCPYHGLFHVALPLTISVFCLVPPESHFLTKLHSLKMLSITPSQLENGKKITTYDYRCAGPQASVGLWKLGWCVRWSPASSALWRWRQTCPRGSFQRGTLCRQREGRSERGLQCRLYPRPAGIPDFETLQRHCP